MHEVLYKRAKTGKIVYYKIWVDGDTILKQTGQLGTANPVTHTEVCTPKNVGKSNETTGHQQAVSQSLSDWNKKRDEGYKSLADLNVVTHEDPKLGTVYTEDFGMRCSTNMLDSALERRLPQFNTSATGDVKPMLATDYTKVKSIPYPVLVQPKLDGVRCLVIVSTDNDSTKSIRFLSRNGKDYSFPHLLTQKWPKGNYILDGEIYSDELSFQSIIAATKKVREETNKLHFRCYDMVTEHPQVVRLNDIKRMIEEMASAFVHVVSHTTANNLAEVKAFHDGYVELGYEGAMIRFVDGKYGQGQHSRELLKVKEFDETEFYFQRWEKGLRDEDLIAVCLTSIHGDAKEFKAKMVGTVAQKKEMEVSNIKADSLITVKHFGWTEDKLPRFPIGKAIRHDL